jgi:hypothetical protein
VKLEHYFEAESRQQLSRLTSVGLGTSLPPRTFAPLSTLYDGPRLEESNPPEVPPHIKTYLQQAEIEPPKSAQDLTRFLQFLRAEKTRALEKEEDAMSKVRTSVLRR